MKRKRGSGAEDKPTTVITEQKLNNFIVKPVIKDGGEPDISKIKGGDIVPTLYANIFLCAKKKSGKTNLIYTMLEEFCDKDTRVYIFASTVNKDKTYEQITKMMDRKKISYDTFTAFDDARTGEAHLADILHAQDEEEERKLALPPTRKGPRFSNAEKKERKKSKEAPDEVFVFDDLGTDLRHPLINQLLKTNRHRKCKVIIASQYIHDLQPQAIKQLDFIAFFRSFSEDKLLAAYNLLDLSIGFPEFEALYSYATEEPFNFLFVDVRRDVFRKNFNTLLSINQ